MTEQDWHPADVVAAIRKAGWSLRKLATAAGYANPAVLANANQRPWPKGERIIADAIGVAPEVIWPSRYAARAERAARVAARVSKIGRRRAAGERAF